MESAQLQDEERSARAGDKTTFLPRPAAERKPSAPEDYYPAAKPERSQHKAPAKAEELEMPELGNGIVVVSTYDGQWHPADGEKKGSDSHKTG